MSIKIPASQDGDAVRGRPIMTQYTENLFNSELVDWQFADLSINITKVNGGLGSSLNIKTENAPYTLLVGDLAYFIRIDTAGTVTLPNGLNAGFQVILANVSGGTVTLLAETTLNSQLTTLGNQWSAVTIINIGGDVWEAYGDLSP